MSHVGTKEGARWAMRPSLERRTIDPELGTLISVIERSSSAGREFEIEAAFTDRRDMRYRMIIGMDILRESGFLVGPSRGESYVA